MKTFSKLREEMGMSSGPSNVVSSGGIAGSGEKGGEPGVHLKRKKSVVIQSMVKRKFPKV
jgi:hypothetical protein